MQKQSVTSICRELRQNQTPLERKLWDCLRTRQFNQLKFRRQHPFVYQSIQGEKKFFIADFYCAQKKILIELDGKVHDFYFFYDANRDSILAKLGLRTLRIKNEELVKDINEVMARIKLIAGL